MSEKQQHTAANLRNQMENRYGDDLDHKHNKMHLIYRQHCRSHPAQKRSELDKERSINDSTGLLRQFKLRKIRKRLDKGRIH